jgi:hypothetical protein
MKTCAYCGQQYPEDTLVRPVDQQPLEALSETRKNVTGTWRGSYTGPKGDDSAPVPFTLELKQGWFGHFTGQVSEDPTLGMPGRGTIDGYFGFPNIHFVKRMPVCYVRSQAGGWITLRQHLRMEGFACEHDREHPPVIYQGAFFEPNRARGTWIIGGWFVPLPGDESYPFAEVSGDWTLEFAGP